MMRPHEHLLVHQKGREGTVRMPHRQFTHELCFQSDSQGRALAQIGRAHV